MSLAGDDEDEEAGSEPPAASASPDPEHAAYLAERKALIDAELKSSENYDKYMIAMTSASLGLSVLYVNNIADMRSPALPWLLPIARTALVIALSSVVASLRMSQLGMRRQRELLDAAQARKYGAVPHPASRRASSRRRSLASAAAGFREGRPLARFLLRIARAENELALYTDWFNGLSLIAFLAGIVSLVIFGAANSPPAPSPPPGAATKNGGTEEMPGTRKDLSSPGEKRPAPMPERPDIPGDKKGFVPWTPPVSPPKAPAAPGPPKPPGK